MKKHVKLLRVIITINLLIIASVTAGNSQLLPAKGIGCWVQNSSIGNPYIQSDVFAWYLMPINLIDGFQNIKNKPVFWAASVRNAEVLNKEMEKYKGKIAGVVWDYETRGTTQEKTENDLRKAYLKAKALNLFFGIVVSADPAVSLRMNGVSYNRAAQFADFLMPMIYLQAARKYPGVENKRMRAMQLMEIYQKETSLPIIPVINLETTRTIVPIKITPNEIVGIYKDLPVQGFAVWNAKHLDSYYIQALGKLIK